MKEGLWGGKEEVVLEEVVLEEAVSEMVVSTREAERAVVTRVAED